MRGFKEKQIDSKENMCSQHETDNPHQSIAEIKSRPACHLTELPVD